ncbi:MAG TPA: PAS domain S-box protein, partial [Syntrophales bacterium]
KTLKKSEENFRHSLEDSPLGIRVVTAKGETIYANKVILDIYGYANVEELNKIPLKERYTPQSYAEFHIRKKARDQGDAGPSEYEINIVRKNGEIRRLQVLRKDVLWNGIKKFQVIYQDITERRQAEEALRENEQRLKEAQKVAHIGHWELDPKLGTPKWSDEIFRIFGLDPKDNEPSFVNHKTHLHSDDWPILNEAVAKASTDGVPFDIQFRIVQPSGEIRWMHALGTTIMDSNGVISKLFGTAQDITERKKAEEAIKNSELKYRNIFENAVEGIYQSTIEGRFITANAACAQMSGYDSPEELMESIKDIGTQLYVHPEDRNRLMEIREAKGFVEDFEVEFYKKDGSKFWVVVNARTVKDEQGKILHIEGLIEDITIRKHAEEKLQQTLDSLKKAVNATIQVMVSAVEIRDPYTAGHQKRVADLAHAIATEMKLPHDKIDGILMAGSIHDIGKLSIPAEILSKPTKLTDIEFSLIKEHSRSGYEMLKDVESPWPLAQIVYQHHERMNGSGYPRNLKGEEILIEARIMAVSDVVEAMASYRPCRPALGIEAALGEIEKNRGTFYDNAVVDACMRLFREKGFQLEGSKY